VVGPAAPTRSGAPRAIPVTMQNRATTSVVALFRTQGEPPGLNLMRCLS
jgi:hypothetical protein